LLQKKCEKTGSAGGSPASFDKQHAGGTPALPAKNSLAHWSKALKPPQKERSGFRQKAESFNFQRFAALCRDAATGDEWFCRGLYSVETGNLERRGRIDYFGIAIEIINSRYNAERVMIES
jgi:hypothetical protein